MKRSLKLAVVVSLFVLLCTVGASAKFLTPFYGSLADLANYLGTCTSDPMLAMEAHKAGLVIMDPGIWLEGKQTSYLVNGNKNGNDFGAGQFKNGTDTVDVHYAVDLDPNTVGLLIEVGGTPVKLWGMMTIQQIISKTEQVMMTKFTKGYEYCHYMASYVAFNLQAFIDPYTGALFAPMPTGVN